MIEQSKFLGISLETRRNRRLIVLAYYALLLLLVAVGIYHKRLFLMSMLAQTVTLGGLFGGIKRGGMVKPYTERANLQADPGELQQLGLSGRRTFAALDPLDERETAERDHAHFVAYRIFCLTLALCFLGYALAGIASDFTAKLLASNALCLLWFLTVYAYSLPQSVILWTEPDPLPDGSLSLVRQH